MTRLFHEALLVILVLSGVPLLACDCTGFFASLLQTITQIQEQSISYAIKILTLMAVLTVFSDIGAQVLLEFSARVFEAIGAIEL